MRSFALLFAAAKMRLLLIAWLTRFGSLPPATDTPRTRRSAVQAGSA